ncbi:MAG: alpha/beta fold hydrolase [Thermoleophilia bacterium]
MKFVQRAARPQLVAGAAATTVMVVAILLLVLGAASNASAQGGNPPGAVTLQMHTVASVEPGVNLSLREKRLASQTAFSSDRIVILLEPFGVPAAESFDSSLPGFSMMEYLAQNGYDVWALDFRGFGASDRPAAFNQPFPNWANPPQMRAADAVLDVDAAMQYICNLRGTSKTNILGWSWGAVVASQYAGMHPERMERLVIYGGMHSFRLASMTNAFDDPNYPQGSGRMKSLPAYQLAEPSMSINHWRMQGMCDQQGNNCMAPHTPAAETELSRIFLASDPTSGTRSPASIRRALGPMVDLYEIWYERPVFDASLITAPTLIIRGDHDTFSNDPGFMPALTNAPIKRYIELPLATHWAIYEEQAAPQLMSEVAKFMSAGRPGLTVGITGARWVSYADYTNGLLSVDYRISNPGSVPGFNVQVTGSTATDGVSLASSQAPVSLGDISSGSATSFTLKYQVPPGLGFFRATVLGSAEDGAGVPYSYPGA